MAFAAAVGVPSGPAQTAPAGRRSTIYVTAAGAPLVQQGLAAAAPANPDAAGFVAVPAPSVRTVQNNARATTAPWIESNVWRFLRGLQKVNYDKLPTGSAPMAAAEASLYGVDAILNPDPADLEELGRVLAFLKTVDQPVMPVMANIGVVDDGSPELDEVLNMLSRRNLLYRVVKAPDSKLNLNVRLGNKDFPKESVENPSDFAARVREKLGDDKRLVRLYGTSTVIAHLTGDSRHARLVLLSFTGGRGGGGARSGGQGRGPGAGARGDGGGGFGQTPRVRVLGHYRPSKFAAYGAQPDAKLIDVEQTADAAEFTLPGFRIAAVVDLESTR
jgi:hypothetical protein